jgi:hypothetical protein
VLLKEWEVTRQPDGAPDMQLLARYEREIAGEAGLFGALVADRRLFMGPDCTYTQDYRRRYSDRELLCILQNGLKQTERLFDELQPDVLMGFICVTMLDYLAYLFARARGVKVLNLRPTRVADLVTFGSTLNDPSPEFARAYASAATAGAPAGSDAAAHIRRVREQHGRYEGVVQPSDRPALKLNAARRSLTASAAQVIRNYREYSNGEAAHDNHVPHPLRALYFATVVNPLRARWTAARLGSQYTTPERMLGARYAFYPLHTEPEVSLLVYGRPYLNQIEVVRAVAMSLPVDMYLIIKEHPWMVGKRTLGSYRKLLDIPKVILAAPSSQARTWIQGAQLVVVVTGSVALEAAILGKPVVTFGDCPYNLLPRSMVRRCDDLRDLQNIVRDLLQGYRLDEDALHAYIAAVFASSASVNLYSILLQKKGVHAERSSTRSQEVAKLAAHVTRLLREESAPPHTPGAANW